MTEFVADKITNATIEILGRFYSIRCPEMELAHLEEAAKYLNQHMLEVQESGKAINLERIAIISALNIAYQFLQLEQQKNGLLTQLQERLKNIQDRMDRSLHHRAQAEFIYMPNDEDLVPA